MHNSNIFFLTLTLHLSYNDPVGSGGSINVFQGVSQKNLYIDDNNNNNNNKKIMQILKVLQLKDYGVQLWLLLMLLNRDGQQ